MELKELRKMRKQCLVRMGSMMTYKHRSKNITCTVLDASDGYVIYQYMHDGLVVTNKAWVDDFLDEWEVLK